MHGGKPNRVLDDEGYFDRFAGIADIVRENGATLLQENVVKFRAGNLSVLKKMKRHLGESTAFCLDIKQCIRGGYSPFEAVEALGSSIKHIHISDNLPGNDCMLPGKGSFDFTGFFDLCKRSGFSGDSIVEVYRDAFGDEDELYASYGDFVKSLNLLK